MIIGYAFTLALSVLFSILIASVIIERKEILELFKGISKVEVVALFVIVAFFLAFSLLLVHPAEQLYFDENIYQGVALNILHNGNALWCQYGTGYLSKCFANAIYHDPIEISFFLAIAFAIFGIGIKTAYAMQLLVGTASIIFFFLLVHLLLKKQTSTMTTTAIFALMPELFIWSRTQADPDLYFMMLTILAFLSFEIFVNKKNMWTMIMLFSALELAVYARTEGMLLIIVFAVLMLLYGKEGVRNTLRERKAEIIYNINTNAKFMLILLIFFLILLPQIWFAESQLISQPYGQPNGKSAISFQYFKANIATNIYFLLGKFDSISYYPAVFPGIITYLAIIGVILFAMDEYYKNRFGILLTLGLWFLAYFLFYTFFYAGSALYGVDVRFMLSILPPVSILAGIGIAELSEVISFSPLILKAYFRRHIRIGTSNYSKYSKIVQAALFVGLVLVPFTYFAKIITIPVSQMPQQSVISSAIDFFYNNYQKVPSNCMVFTLTPDIWYEFGRGSAQINYIYSNKTSEFAENAKNYSCFVFDYGYWCLVPPNHNGICKFILSSYKTEPLAVGNITADGDAPAFYKLINYTP